MTGVWRRDTLAGKKKYIEATVHVSLLVMYVGFCRPAVF